MKRCTSILLAMLLLIGCLAPGIPWVSAATGGSATKVEDPRTIAIVFDNSGSMYYDYNNGTKSWCRATYAMEVFASMLNKGDTLLIYPMHPISVDGVEYTQDNPFKITEASNAAKIRNIFTIDAGVTPIETIDRAVDGLKAVQGDKKYLIILTDGTTFYKNNAELSPANTKKELETRINDASKDMTVMYLGIGLYASIPQSQAKDYVSKHAKDSAAVLSSLTEMCNQIFGRDTLPKKKEYINGNQINFDISMSKLIVFVQGADIANLRLSGSAVGKLVSTQQTKYSEQGAGDYTGLYGVDESLQGMMVTYEDCGSGSYTLEYSGTATSVEIYYEPDADLDFVFTDADGNEVNPNALYEGEYKVSYGMKDAKTGKLISSALLGKPHYKGSYTINGEKVNFNAEGYSGEIPIKLNMGDTFKADLTATYLSGYTITKNSTDFGWPDFGIEIKPRPAGDLRLEISGGEDTFSLQDLEEGAPYIIKVYYNGQQMTGSALEAVNLTWDNASSNADLQKEFAEDHYKIKLHYRDPANPQDTPSGECSVVFRATYTPPSTSEAATQSTLTYSIKDDFAPLKIQLNVPESYIVISQLEESKEIVATLTYNGAALPAEIFDAVQVQVDCGGLKYTLTPCPEESAYKIKLLPTDGIKNGKYPIKVSAQYTDHIGRVTQAESSQKITLNKLPLWLRWTMILLILLILFIVIWVILHIKVYPKYLHTSRRLSSMNFDAEDVTQSTNFVAEVKKKGVKVQSQYAGRKVGLSMDVTPGKDSYLYKAQKRRSVVVKADSVRKFGPGKIQEAMIGSAKYVLDEDTGKLVPAIPNQKPFPLTNGMMIKYNGTVQDAGIDKDFEVTSKLNFKKK